MGQKVSKKKATNNSKKTHGSVPRLESVGTFWTVVPEKPYNICGVLDDDYIIYAPMDDPLERDFTFYRLYSYAEDNETKNAS